MSTVLPLPFVAGSMTRIAKLSALRPVYQIDYAVGGGRTESFVVKAERRVKAVGDNMGRSTNVARHNQQNSVQTGFMLMRDAARGGLGRVLNDKETAALAPRAMQLLPAADRDDFKATYNDGLLWLLLGLKAGLVDLEQIMNGGNAVKAMKILLSLRSPENLDRLGRILATDMFLGNSDRFNNDLFNQGISNFSNIFFVEKATGEFKIKGLDVFDPSRNTALLSQTVRIGCAIQDAKHNVNYWAGPLLKDPIQLRRVAKNALTSLHAELSSVLRNAGVGPGILASYDFADHHVDSVVAGMNAALIVIKASCKQRLAQMRKAKADTDGLKSRMKLMNWST